MISTLFVRGCQCRFMTTSPVGGPFISNTFYRLILFQITESIPIEIVFVILSLLGPKELLKVSLLNSFYRGLSRDDALWKAICSSWGINQGTKLILDKKFCYQA